MVTHKKSDYKFLLNEISKLDVFTRMLKVTYLKSKLGEKHRKFKVLASRNF